MSNYVQCTMRRGNTEHTAWIPEKFAKVGKYIRIKEVDGWKVIRAGGKMDKKYVNDRSQDYKNTRKASDI